VETQPLWTGPELSTLWGVPCDAQLRCTGISLDSRTLVPGDLFIALQGQDPRFHGASSQGQDGQRFAAHALAQGAAAVVVRESLGAGAREIVVPDPFEALWTLARGARRRARDGRQLK
jgi:UDP-N-acetylmuramyl pentapeptide synthase